MKWRDCSVLIFLGLLLQVSQVSEKTVLQQRAYMLFYVRHISSVPRRAPDITHTENRPSAASAKVEPTPLEGISTVKKVSMLPTSTHAAEAQQSKVNSNVRLLDFFHFRSFFIAQLFLVFPFRLEWFPFAFGIFFFQLLIILMSLWIDLLDRAASSQGAVINEQEPSDQAAARAHESTLNEARAVDSSNNSTGSASHKIITKGKGRKSSCLRSISFGPRRFLLLALSIQKRKRSRRSHDPSLTTGSIRESPSPEGCNALEAGASSSSSWNGSWNRLTRNWGELPGGSPWI